MASNRHATHFEWQPDEGFGLSRENAARSRTLLKARDQDLLMPLEDFIVLTDVSSLERGVADRLYSQAWGFFRFLLEQRPEGLRKYLQRLAASRPGMHSTVELRRDLSRALGPISALDDDWGQYLTRLERPVGPDAPPRHEPVAHHPTSPGQARAEVFLVPAPNASNKR
jgi:hypothetical protein